MKPRMEHWKVAPGGFKAMSSLEAYLRDSGLDAWREAPYYTDRERAALEWTEALTNVTDGHVPDAVYDAVRGHFSDKGTGQPHLGRRRHQRLEPRRHRVPLRSRHLQARGARVSEVGGDLPVPRRSCRCRRRLARRGCRCGCTDRCSTESTR